MNRILAIGEQAAQVARELYPDAEVDATTLTPGKKRTGYDAVLSYLALQKVPYRKIHDVMKSWMEALKPAGEIVIFVPSLEWAATEVLSANPSPVLIAHLFGLQKGASEFHSSAFTMMDLRSLCASAGIAVTHASTGEYMIGEYACGCHSVRGIKKA